MKLTLISERKQFLAHDCLFFLLSVYPRVTAVIYFGFYFK